MIGLLKMVFQLGLFVVFMGASAGWAQQNDNVIHVIVNASHDGEALSQDQLARIYAMQKRVWSDGTTIKVFRLPDSHPAHKKFVNEKLHMQPYLLNRLWHRLVFSGTGSTPQEVGSIKEMKTIVNTTKGAIGYIAVVPSARDDESMVEVQQ